jgi:hypothetical protein
VLDHVGRPQVIADRIRVPAHPAEEVLHRIRRAVGRPRLPPTASRSSVPRAQAAPAGRSALAAVTRSDRSAARSAPPADPGPPPTQPHPRPQPWQARLDCPDYHENPGCSTKAHRP